MSIKQLRAAISPCCGLGANRAEVDTALNNVSAQLSTQEQLLVETLNILEHSLKAIHMNAVTEELLQNHYGAIKAIRDRFEKTTEFSNDPLQTNNTNLCQSTSQDLGVEKTASVETTKSALVRAERTIECKGTD